MKICKEKLYKTAPLLLYKLCLGNFVQDDRGGGTRPGYEVSFKVSDSESSSWLY
jgi:hypothetical protein